MGDVESAVTIKLLEAKRSLAKLASIGDENFEKPGN